MRPWCTVDDVSERVMGTPAVDLLTEYADHATEILYALTGRRFGGETQVTITRKIRDGGYVKIGDYSPVHTVVSATVEDVDVHAELSLAGTYVTVDRRHRRLDATFVLDVGQEPPASGRLAAAALAAEMVRGDPRYESTTGATDTRPAFRLTSISRQGVTYSYADPGDIVKSDMTAIYEVDLFLRAVNPHGTRYQPRVATV